MKKIYLLACLSFVITSAFGQLLTEPFNYTPDPSNGLATQSSSLWSIVNTGDSILVTSGSLTYPGLATATGNKVAFDGAGTDYYTGFTPQTAGTVYYSFVMNISSLGSLNTTGGYFITLMQDGSTSLFGGTVWTRLSTTSGKYNIGVSTRSNSAVSWLAADLDPGASVFVVAAYEINSGTGDDVAKIWLNTPAIGGSEPAADAIAATGSDLGTAGIGRILLRQANTTQTAFTEVDELRVGTTWADVTPGGAATPILSASPLTSFGNVCTGTTAGPNSFTISGSNLTSANVTVAALNGFEYSTTAGGTYTPTLSLTQAGGTYSQEIFVRFSPTLVQSYDGNIAIAGGGVSTAINVAAVGSGIANAVPDLTTGGATSIAQTSATLAGTITGTGCSAITAYGIEYSTTSGFPNGSGIAVPSTNISGGDFSSDLTGLTQGTTYYYHAYATNSTGTGYGPEQMFMTTPGALSIVENFNYTAGQLLTANGWAAHSAGGTNAQTVTAPGLTYPSHAGSGIGSAVTMTTSGEDVNKTNGTATSGSVYMSFMVNLSAAQTGDYFIGLFQPTTSLPLRVFAKSDGSGGFNFGINKNSTTATVYETTARSFGTTYFIVAKYTFNTGTNTDDEVSLWVNPALGGTETAATIPNVTSTASDATAVSGVYLRQGSTASASTQQVDAILAGITWAEVTPAAAPNPTLSATTLTGFGNVCINTTAGPNSFTITGTNLNTTNITVGALAGFTYSTTSGGTYTTTLDLTQTGGSYSQEIFVRFNPTAVQLYDGTIPVSGGGAVAINVNATGAGINPLPIVTSGGATAITQNTATVHGLASFGGCSPLNSNYGIEYSTTVGFPNGTGTPVLSTNLSTGAFSSDLTGLTSGTTYYYHAFASNAAGTAYGAEMSFTTVSPNPTITATAFTAFGNVCINTTAGPNSFTINATNLTTADVTVGALAGFTYSTTAGGTYTATLTLPQPGGTYSQEIFVRFSPTAVQSYNGNISVGGGGATAINVAASGAGINTTATVTTGGASAITTTTATLAGSIPATGCTAVSAYGIEYSTVNNFPNGSGTQVASSNLSGGNFTSAVSGLTPATTYYYKAYATNAGGTAYGSQMTFVTATPPPPVLTATSLSSFGEVCITTTAGPNSFTINGSNLTTAAITVGPLAGFTFSETAGGTYVSTLSITQTGGTQSKTVYVRFTPAAVQSYNGNIPVSGGGATAISVAAVGSGVNTTPTVATGAASDLTNHSATLSGAIGANGCSNVTAYGIEFSGISGFANGTGTQVPSSNLSGGVFSSNINGLVQGATYYFKAYATNNGGTSYGLEQAFIVPSIGSGLALYPVPAERGTSLRVTMDNITPGYYGLQFFNSSGQLVYQWNMNIQVNFINQTFTVPATIQKGTYRVNLVNHLGILATKSILIM